MATAQPAHKPTANTRPKTTASNTKVTAKQPPLSISKKPNIDNGKKGTLRKAQWGDPSEEEDGETDDEESIFDAQLSERHLRSLGLIRSKEEPSAMTLSRTLGVIANYEGIVENPSTRNIVLACSYLVANLGPNDIAEAVSEAIAKQMENIHEEIKLTFQTAREELREDLVEAATKISEQTLQANNAIQETAKSMEKTATSYRDVLASNPPASNIPFTSNGNIDPRTRAREAIRMRQVLVDVDEANDKADLKSASVSQLVDKANTAIKTVDPKTKFEVCAVKRLNNGGILFEANNDAAARWINKNAEAFANALSQGAILQRRTFNMIARFVSVDFDPTSGIQLFALQEKNNIPQDSIATIKWIKLIEHRSPTQRTAHLAIKLYDQTVANDLAVRGLFILGERIGVEKDKKEPVRCYKCQGWDHLAATCVKSRNFCGRCGDTTHMTRDCTSQDLYCTPCGRQGHVSGDRRQCPAYRAKRDELNARMPENSMPYFPTDEPWTHSTAQRASQARNMTYNPQITVQAPQSQRQRKNTGRQPPVSRETSLAPPSTYQGRSLSPNPPETNKNQPATGPNAVQRASREPSVAPYYRGSLPPDSR
ncbi:hypothetical protein D9615_009260 [Tricholomella constricta]|uniref:CCHC-type domain-containing protein n=1 Tax=Tricholomella constricta TaxID=117010 RepID=A0A8H5GWM8_9AGAR|nr:hypothetical protein D9615_009260 [Tricholomella constricta]